MSLFDRFRRETFKTELEPSETKQRFESLKSKYGSALNAAAKEHIIFQSVHVVGDKLFVRGTAPSPEARSLFRGAIQNVDSDPNDIVADISVSNRFEKSSVAGKKYVVKVGDTLSKISKEFYGDPNESTRIYFANAGRIDKNRDVRVGQELTIPVDDTF